MIQQATILEFRMFKPKYDEDWIVCLFIASFGLVIVLTCWLRTPSIRQACASHLSRIRSKRACCSLVGACKSGVLGVRFELRGN